MNIVDAFLIVFILLIGIICAFRGLVDAVFGKFAFLAGLLAAFYISPVFIPNFARFISNKYLCIIFSFLTVFAVVFVFLKLTQLLINALCSGELIGSLNHALGFFFGIFEGCLLVCILFIFVRVQPWFQVSPVLNESFLYKLFLPVLNGPVRKFSGILV